MTRVSMEPVAHDLAPPDAKVHTRQVGLPRQATGSLSLRQHQAVKLCPLLGGVGDRAASPPTISRRVRVQTSTSTPSRRSAFRSSANQSPPRGRGMMASRRRPLSAAHQPPFTIAHTIPAESNVRFLTALVRCQFLIASASMGPSLFGLDDICSSVSSARVGRAERGRHHGNPNNCSRQRATMHPPPGASATTASSCTTSCPTRPPVPHLRQRHDRDRVDRVDG